MGTPVEPGSQNPSYPVPPPGEEPGQELSDSAPATASGPDDGDGCGCYGPSGGGLPHPTVSCKYIFDYYRVEDVPEPRRMNYPEDYDWSIFEDYREGCGNGAGNDKGWSQMFVDSKQRITDEQGRHMYWMVQAHKEIASWLCICVQDKIPSDSFPGCPNGMSLQFERDASTDESNPNYESSLSYFRSANLKNGHWKHLSIYYTYFQTTRDGDRKYEPYEGWNDEASGYWNLTSYKDISFEYMCKPCADPDIPLPEMIVGFNYSTTLSELDIEKLNELKKSCSKLDGKLEHGYEACLNIYRCKSKPGWEWVPEPGDDGPSPGHPKPPPGYWKPPPYSSELVPCNELTREAVYGDPCSCLKETCCTYFDNTYEYWTKEQYRCKDYFAGTEAKYLTEYNPGKRKKK